MPTLNWIGKETVVKHHKEAPFRLLEPVPKLLPHLSTGRYRLVMTKAKCPDSIEPLRQ